jgi:hypothetical protein
VLLVKLAAGWFEDVSAFVLRNLSVAFNMVDLGV